MNPILKLFLIILISFNQLNAFFFRQIKKPFSIMIDPNCTSNKDEKVNNENMHSIAIEFAKQLKKIIELKHSNLRVILTHMSCQDHIESLQNANFANKLNVDFYLSINLYKTQNNLTEAFLYHYLNEPFFVQSSERLHFYNFDDAHLINITKTLQYGNKLAIILQNEIYKNKFNFKGFLGIPFKPFVGIKSPAIAIEIGLSDKNKLEQFINPIMEFIEQMV